jgi:hypothetical protein
VWFCNALVGLQSCSNFLRKFVFCRNREKGKEKLYSYIKTSVAVEVEQFLQKFVFCRNREKGKEKYYSYMKTSVAGEVEQ